jgi:hypothetical protein
LVDDQDVRASRAVRFGEISPEKKWNAQRAEVTVADGNFRDGRSGFSGSVGVAFDVKWIREFQKVGRQAERNGGVFDSGRSFETFQKLLIK